MGFLDKAKKLAEQAQTKLDEVQGQFNQQQAGTSSGPITEYDKHGRPVPPAGGDTPAAAATMDDDEHIGVVELIARELGDEGVVVAGTGSNDTRHAVHLTERAVAAGVDAVLSVTPYYNKPNRRGIVAHFTEVAKAAGDTPVILYNIPGRTATNMPPDLLAELAQIDGIDAVKQANSDELQLIDGLAVLAGNDDIYAKCLDIGGTGGICVASHVAGNEMRRMYDEPEARADIDASLQEVYAAMFVTASPAPVKAALKMLGHDTGPLRLPLVECDETERTHVHDVLARHGLLGVTAA
jgi:4-hydroxy-tetrahydrodipicolinate synthase